MAKGQLRGNREIKKPKKKKEVAATTASLSAKSAQVPFGGAKKPPKKWREELDRAAVIGLPHAGSVRDELTSRSSAQPEDYPWPLPFRMHHAPMTAPIDASTSGDTIPLSKSRSESTKRRCSDSTLTRIWARKTLCGCSIWIAPASNGPRRPPIHAADAKHTIPWASLTSSRLVETSAVASDWNSGIHFPMNFIIVQQFSVIIVKYSWILVSNENNAYWGL
jgi:hypothetical protein